MSFADQAGYLEAQLERLRLLLERAIAHAAGRADEAAALERRAEIARREIAQAAGDPNAPSLGLEVLRKRFQLDDEDIDVLLHAAATCIDPSLGKLHTKLSGVAFHPWLDVGLALQMHHDGVGERLRARARFQPDAPLIAHRLLTLDRSRPEARENLLACELKLPARVAAVVLGSDPTGGAGGYAQLVEPIGSLDEVVLPDETRRELERLVAAQPALKARLDEWGYATLLPPGAGAALTLLLTGPPGTGKTTLAGALAARLKRRLLVVDGPRLGEAGRALEPELDELLLEARLLDAVVLFDDCELLFHRGSQRLPLLHRVLDRATGLVVLATSQPERLDPSLERRVLARVQLEAPAPALREKIWDKLLLPQVPRADDVELTALAKRYELTGGAIRSAVLYAASRAVARGTRAPQGISMADLEAAAQAQLRGDLSAYAERTRANLLTLDALVLPPEVKAQIEEVIAAGRNRAQVLYSWGFSEKLPTGKGLVVLLSGDPGTGKTLAAEVMAAELGLSLYRINPAKVVSKYVGETEKNLNEILAQAKSTHSILFFDEADALFSTRVAKVESANDRFVNMETNFLLQQLERYEGIVILATNLETSIDQAFKRRIAYHVTIPFPKAPDRERIWRTLMPSRAPLGEIDYARLGKSFELSGGHIKNAVLRAAYVAAQRAAPIDHALLAEAAEHECAAAGKLVQNG
jgi:SpoVK/Ycf46/Vps4 family AAA+-type ATPase